MPRKKNEPVYAVAGVSDTLDRIARRCDVPIDKLKLLNPDIKGPVYLLRIGQRERIKC